MMFRDHRPENNIRFPDYVPKSLPLRTKHVLEAESALRYMLTTNGGKDSFSRGTIYERLSLEKISKSTFLYPVLNFVLDNIAFAINSQQSDEDEIDTSDWGKFKLDSEELSELEEPEKTELEQMLDLKEQQLPDLEIQILAAASLSDGNQLVFVAFKDTLSNTFILPTFNEFDKPDFKKIAIASESNLIGMVLEIESVVDEDFSPFVFRNSDYLNQEIWKNQIRLIKSGEISAWFKSRLLTYCSDISLEPDDFSLCCCSYDKNDINRGLSVLLKPLKDGNPIPACNFISVAFKCDLQFEDPYYYLSAPVFFSDDCNFILYQSQLQASSIDKRKKNVSLVEFATSEIIEPAEAVPPMTRKESLDILMTDLGFSLTSFDGSLLKDPALSSLSNLFAVVSEAWNIDIENIKLMRLCYSMEDYERHHIALVAQNSDKQCLLFATSNLLQQEMELIGLGLHLTKKEFVQDMTLMLSGEYNTLLAKKVLNFALDLQLSDINNLQEELAQNYEISLGYCLIQPDSFSRFHFIVHELSSDRKIIISLCFDEEYCFLPFRDVDKFEGFKLVAIY